MLHVAFGCNAHCNAPPGPCSIVPRPIAQGRRDHRSVIRRIKPDHNAIRRRTPAGGKSLQGHRRGAEGGPDLGTAIITRTGTGSGARLLWSRRTGKTSMIAPRRHLLSAAVVLCASALAAAAEPPGEASRSLVLPSIVGSLPAATAAKQALYLPKSARASHGARLVAGRSGPDTSRCDRRGGVAETREGPPCPHARRA